MRRTRLHKGWQFLCECQRCESTDDINIHIVENDSHYASAYMYEVREREIQRILQSSITKETDMTKTWGVCKLSAEDGFQVHQLVLAQRRTFKTVMILLYKTVSDECVDNIFRLAAITNGVPNKLVTDALALLKK